MATVRKSLYEYIVEAIDEHLPARSAVNGKQVYMLAFERYEAAVSQAHISTERLRCAENTVSDEDLLAFASD
jgi:hypothetical protein